MQAISSIAKPRLKNERVTIVYDLYPQARYVAALVHPLDGNCADQLLRVRARRHVIDEIASNIINIVLIAVGDVEEIPRHGRPDGSQPRVWLDSSRNDVFQATDPT